MLKTRQCLLGLRTFLGVASRIWGFILYILRKHLRTIIQYQTVRYDTLPLSPASRNRLNAVKRKILVLDLDETLIHSHHDGVLRPTVRPGTPPDFILKVSQWYELVVFTASMEIYGSAVADKLDNNRGILKRRYYRQHCTLDLGSYIKDLSVVHNDLSSIVILDNSPGAYRSHPGWRVEKMEAVQLDTGQLGVFYTGDSYIILNKHREGAELHMWIGEESSRDEQCACAMLATQLDQFLGGDAIQHRQEQGHETEDFLKLFPNGVSYKP
ncbi:hypothetical protein KOW79_022287 [Hemibagrus wyckioides]|uniref:Mitochondrial import inner membrane translocase subunit TIM50 n=1 Tax=Hemibagrus wyckioides TaxID=337641 RepID=A0A9D3N555_9TELE|nr:hypothetical protein KOW79_022287 [Hemibagrus wyckioides]